MSSPTRWAGVPLADRRAERRALLVEAGFDIFGSQGEAALSVRAVCRACGFNTRYFYESFTDIDELLGAIYDRTAQQLADAVTAEMADDAESVRDRMRTGIRAVLDFGSSDPRRGRVLFTEARANPVLTARRSATQDLLRESATAASETREPDPLTGRVRAAMFTGAMAELAVEWLSGDLGSDLDAVVDRAIGALLLT